MYDTCGVTRITIANLPQFLPPRTMRGSDVILMQVVWVIDVPSWFLIVGVMINYKSRDQVSR